MGTSVVNIAEKLEYQCFKIQYETSQIMFEKNESSIASIFVGITHSSSFSTRFSIFSSLPRFTLAKKNSLQNIKPAHNLKTKIKLSTEG